MGSPARPPRGPGRGVRPLPSLARLLLDPPAPPVGTRGPAGPACRLLPGRSSPSHASGPSPRARGPAPGPPVAAMRRPGGPGAERGPAGRGKRARRGPSFPPSSWPRRSWADGTSRASGSPPASWSHAPGWGAPERKGRGRGRRAARTGRGQEGRQGAGGGGSCGAAVAAGRTARGIPGSWRTEPSRDPSLPASPAATGGSEVMEEERRESSSGPHAPSEAPKP